MLFCSSCFVRACFKSHQGLPGGHLGMFFLMSAVGLDGSVLPATRALKFNITPGGRARLARPHHGGTDKSGGCCLIPHNTLSVVDGSDVMLLRARSRSFVTGARLCRPALLHPWRGHPKAKPRGSGKLPVVGCSFSGRA